MNQNCSSPSWAPTGASAPGPSRARLAPATSRPVAASMPVSRHSNPAARHGVHVASAARWSTNRWPSKSRSCRDVGSDSSGSNHVSCTAGQVISTTSRPPELSRTRWRIPGGWSTQSPAVEHEGVALALVHEAHPTGDAEDQLEADVVKVHLVGHRAGVGDADVRGDEPSALTTRQQVAVQHPGTADAPAGVGEPAESRTPARAVARRASPGHSASPLTRRTVIPSPSSRATAGSSAGEIIRTAKPRRRNSARAPPLRTRPARQARGEPPRRTIERPRSMKWTATRSVLGIGAL